MIHWKTKHNPDFKERDRILFNNDPYQPNWDTEEEMFFKEVTAKKVFTLIEKNHLMIPFNISSKKMTSDKVLYIAIICENPLFYGMAINPILENYDILFEGVRVSGENERDKVTHFLDRIRVPYGILSTPSYSKNSGLYNIDWRAKDEKERQEKSVAAAS